MSGSAVLAVGGEPRARPGGLHQHFSSSAASSHLGGPLPLRLVSMTKCLPPSSLEISLP